MARRRRGFDTVSRVSGRVQSPSRRLLHTVYLGSPVRGPSVDLDRYRFLPRAVERYFSPEAVRPGRMVSSRPFVALPRPRVPKVPVRVPVRDFLNRASASLVCAKRVIRREVLFARRVAGRGGYARKVFTPDSRVSCR